MRTKAGKMPGSLIFPIRNGHGVSDDRFGFNGKLQKEKKMKRTILTGFALLALTGISASRAASVPAVDSLAGDLAMAGGFPSMQMEDLSGIESAQVAAPADLAFFDAPAKPDTVVKKNVKKFAAVGVDKIPQVVLDAVAARYPEYSLVNSGRNDQQEYALIINTKDSVKKTLVVKENGEILSDK